jgi:hypothetical protein
MKSLQQPLLAIFHRALAVLGIRNIRNPVPLVENETRNTMKQSDLKNFHSPGRWKGVCVS